MMAQVPVQVRYAENRLSALRMFLGDEQSTVEKELTACLDRLWEEKIPENVRDFIERSEKREQADKVRERRKTKGRTLPPKKPVSEASAVSGADTRSGAENAT